MIGHGDPKTIHIMVLEKLIWQWFLLKFLPSQFAADFRQKKPQLTMRFWSVHFISCSAVQFASS